MSVERVPATSAEPSLCAGLGHGQLASTTAQMDRAGISEKAPYSALAGLRSPHLPAPEKPAERSQRRSHLQPIAAPQRPSQPNVGGTFRDPITDRARSWSGGRPDRGQ